MGLFTALSERHNDREIYAIELPVGPAVAVIAERWLNGQTPGRDDGGAAGARHRGEHPRRQPAVAARHCAELAHPRRLGVLPVHNGRHLPQHPLP